MKIAVSEWIKKPRGFLWILLGILGLSLISSEAYRWLKNLQSSEDSDYLRVQTVRAKSVEIPVLVETVGSLFPLREAKLTAAMTGKVETIKVAGGSKVKKGTPLIRIVGMTDVLAPFDGYITDWKVKPGEYVNSGTELIDILDTEQLSLRYRVPEQYAPLLKTDQSISLKVPAFPDQEFQATLDFISPVIDRETHTILLHAKVDNPEHALWPGMFAHLKHHISIESQALVLPEYVLNLSLEGYDVLLVKDNQLITRPVKVGTRTKGRIHIVSGLEEGDQVLLTRNDASKAGVRVRAEDWTGDW